VLGSRRKYRFWGPVAVSVMLLTGCGSPGSGTVAPATDPSPSGPSPTPSITSVAVQPLRSETTRGAASTPSDAGKVMTGFGTAVLTEVDKASDAANIVLSPYSIYAVLGMVGQGARENTAAQLNAALGADATQQRRIVTAVDAGTASASAAGKAAEAAEVKAVTGVPGDPERNPRPFEFDVANSLWVEPGRNVKQEFLDALAAGFGVGMYETDFAADPEAARAVINAWVAEHTANRITELLPQGAITVDTVLALVNAVHLSAPWAADFTVTGSAPFTTPSGTVQAEMISNANPFAYAEGADWQSVSIPYEGSQLAMTVILPKEGAWDSVGAELPAVLEKAAAAVPGDEVSLTLPKFTVDTSADLVPVMKALGVTDLFGPADLSGIAGRPGELFCSALVHQAVITVDEEGTEASAASAAVVAESSAPMIVQEITVNRPFYFVVHDTTTSAPLFLGQVTDPTA